jgi:hypothetical protein
MSGQPTAGCDFGLGSSYHSDDVPEIALVDSIEAVPGVEKHAVDGLSLLAFVVEIQESLLLVGHQPGDLVDSVVGSLLSHLPTPWLLPGPRPFRSQRIRRHPQSRAPYSRGESARISSSKTLPSREESKSLSQRVVGAEFAPNAWSEAL